MAVLRRYVPLALLGAIAAASVCGAQAGARPAALTIGGHQHVPTTSVNMVDLVWSYVGTGIGNRTSASAAMRAACSRGFTYLRMSATPFWPNELRSTWIEQPDAFWQAYDDLMDDADSAGCRLGPSILWFTFVFSDVAGEPLQQLLVEGSRSRTLLRNFTQELVLRYAHRETVAFWELGNELNLLMDLNATQQQPGVAPQMGTPTKRTQADNISTADGAAIYTAMASWIRSADALSRPISTGHSIPRPQAYHLARSYHDPQRDWTKDTFEQFAQVLGQTSTMADIISVHFYNGTGVERFGLNDPNGAGLLRFVKNATDSIGKPLYVGEFGQPSTTDWTQPPSPRQFSRAVLDEVVELCIPMSTVWIWQFYQSAGKLTPFTLVPGRDDDYINYTRVCWRDSSSLFCCSAVI